ncbi:UNVERIFIED_CONTAM: Cadherin-12 [Gekko kuhli]
MCQLAPHQLLQRTRQQEFLHLLHSDLDKGVGSVKYTLSGDGAGTVFTIDETTGDIHAIRSLDREEKPFYTLRAQAVDIDTRKPLEPESEFIIKVQDINDNEPKFLDGPYVASVPEMSPVVTSNSILIPLVILQPSPLLKECSH